ncbi:unnamed protein product, partial [Owenia fusiformis]
KTEKKMESAKNIAEKVEPDDHISMVDVLEEENKLEEDATAVLGDSDDKNCTYLMGYIPRQAVYSCVTCKSDANGPAGMCLACCLVCHEGHDLLELYTKREFRCDCGNSKFPNFECKLTPKKCAINEDNSYNQNYRGLYCTCHRPYPDHDDSIEDEMIQCVICEDWYHGRHLGRDPPDTDIFQEMICKDCMAKHEFLWAYTVQSTVTSKMCQQTQDVSVNVDTVSPVKEATNTADIPESSVPKTEEVTKCSTSSDGVQPAPTVEPLLNVTSEDDTPLKEEKINGASNDIPVNKNDSTVAEDTSVGSICKYGELSTRKFEVKNCATFWKDGWRSKLCTCASCKEMYTMAKVQFLTDQSDTVLAYEERGRTKHGGSQYERGMNVLSSMDRSKQVEMLHGYNDLKTELSDYLKKFAENGKVVRQEDIKEFFEGMSSRKRQKVETSIPHFCR